MMNSTRKNAVNVSTTTKPPNAVWLAQCAEHHALEHPEQVDRREDHADGRGRPPEQSAGSAHGIEFERAEEHEELADESIQSGQAERREHEHAEEPRIERPAVR